MHIIAIVLLILYLAGAGAAIVYAIRYRKEDPRGNFRDWP